MLSLPVRQSATLTVRRLGKVSAQMGPYCNRPLMKIDHYGEMLVGCIDCNRWGHPGDDKLVMELMPEDLSALKTIRQ